MRRRVTLILIVALAIIAHVAVHEWCDASAKRWVVKGKLGRFGYEELDHDSPKIDRYGILHNSTSVYVGLFKVTVPLSVSSLLLAQITVPLVILSFLRTKKKRRPDPKMNQEQGVEVRATLRSNARDATPAI